MAVELQDRKRASKGLKSWLDDVAQYEREFKKWEGRGDKIIRRYRDEFRDGRQSYQEARFNILWSNVQTLCAATYARVPKPDVSRRFRDNDPVGRVASLILERALDFHIGHYSDYRSALRNVVMDRFLPGRGTIWVRYEPHFKDPKDADGVEITEDAESPADELDYECAAVDYVHWKDFGHNVARTWEEVNRVWRKVYMTKDMVQRRFGKEVAKMLAYDSSAQDQSQDKHYRSDEPRDKACVFEGWDKLERKAVWFSKNVKDFIDERPDPLGLEDFFPCPRPLFATITNESLVPLPDYTLYQDQANELDILCDRIDGLVKALQVKGVYDASLGVEIARIFSEGENNTLLPVKDWARFAEKNGLEGSIDLVDILPIAQALEQAYKAFEEIKGQIYEITGISDIIRGETEASETATAQEIKGQYASLRLKTSQEDVARFATDILQIMAQVMCKKFEAKTILTQSAANQLSQEDQQLVPQAMQLLMGDRFMNPDAEEGANPLRQFRVEVSADTLVYIDEQQEKEAAVEFLTATGTFITQMGEVLAQTPAEAKGPVTRLLMEMLKYGVTRYKVGKTIEGTFDETAEQLVKLASMAAQQPQPPSPEMVKAQAEQQKGQIQISVAQQKANIEMQKLQAKQQFEREQMRLDAEKAQLEMNIERERMGMEQQMAMQDMALQGQQHQADLQFSQEQNRMRQEHAVAQHRQKMAQAKVVPMRRH